MVAPDKLTRGMVIDKELKAEIERRYNGWDDLCQKLTEKESQRQELMMAFERQGNSAQEVITELRQQLATLKAELKCIGEAIDDPRTDLTMTMSEIIIELKQQLTDSQKQATLLRGRLLASANYIDALGGNSFDPRRTLAATEKKQ